MSANVPYTEVPLHWTNINSTVQTVSISNKPVERYEDYQSIIYRPGAYPAIHQDIENSKYPGVTTCNILNKIRDSRAELDQQFTPDSLTAGLPRLLISADRREKQNAGQYQFYMDQEPVVVNKPGCDEPFNVRSLNDAAGLQAGFARNIDLDSELRRINHFTDKCYYDSYKYHPDDAPAPNGLYCNRDALVKDYSAVGQPGCARTSNPKSGITPAQQQTPIPDDKYSSGNRVNYGTNLVVGGNAPSERTRDYTPCNSLGMRLPAGTCQPGGIPQTFPQCDSGFGIDARAQQIINWRAQQHKETGCLVPEYYRFNGDIADPQKRYTANFPCQRLFNNNTKRSSLPNLFNTFDPNPRCLT